PSCAGADSTYCSAPKTAMLRLARVWLISIIPASGLQLEKSLALFFIICRFDAADAQNFAAARFGAVSRIEQQPAKNRISGHNANCSKIKLI
ncbi:hypothetical protein, partial [Pseudomonas sp. MWU12-2115]